MFLPSIHPCQPSVQLSRSYSNRLSHDPSICSSDSMSLYVHSHSYLTLTRMMLWLVQTYIGRIAHDTFCLNTNVSLQFSKHQYSYANTQHLLQYNGQPCNCSGRSIMTLYCYFSAAMPRVVTNTIESRFF